MERVTSATFTHRQPSLGREKALYEIRKILINRIFLGIYEERRYIDRIKKYRDVVMISPSETELLADLKIIKCSHNEYFESEWVGITGPEFEGQSDFCFWVKLFNVPFGHFWFQIKEIIFEEGEISLKLKCIRSVRLQDFEDSVKKSNKKIEREVNKERNEQSSHFLLVSHLKRNTSLVYLHLKDTIQQIQPYLTWKNFVLILKFIVGIAIVLITTVVTFMRYMGDYVLKLIREFALILHVISPILVQIIDCLTKVIGGFFILMALLFKNRTNSDQLLQNIFQSQHEKRMLPVNSRPLASPQITVLSSWRERNRILNTSNSI